MTRVFLFPTIPQTAMIYSPLKGCHDVITSHHPAADSLKRCHVLKSCHSLKTKKKNGVTLGAQKLQLTQKLSHSALKSCLSLTQWLSHSAQRLSLTQWLPTRCHSLKQFLLAIIHSIGVTRSRSLDGCSYARQLSPPLSLPLKWFVTHSLAHST